MSAFQLEHHAFNVFVVPMRLEELQALLGITPLQDFDGFLSRAPRIHFALIRHVKVNGVAPGKRPALILDAIHLSGGKQTENGASRPARPIRRRAPVNFAYRR